MQQLKEQEKAVKVHPFSQPLILTSVLFPKITENLITLKGSSPRVIFKPFWGKQGTNKFLKQESNWPRLTFVVCHDLGDLRIYTAEGKIYNF